MFSFWKIVVILSLFCLLSDAEISSNINNEIDAAKLIFAHVVSRINLFNLALCRVMFS